MKRALIADVQRMSIDNGPGIRTVVFFKGCPLSCEWCHNPECISFEKQVMFYPEKCIGCGKCSEGCYSGAKVVCGKEYTGNELLLEVSEDIEYYGFDGGVTLSGGEPMVQKEFLKEFIPLCKKTAINLAIETSLYMYDEEILREMDIIIADLKIWDSSIHKKYTGVGNEIIKENFIKLNNLKIPIVVHTPVIPEIEQRIDKISEFLKSLNNVKKYELLPYHPLGNSKKHALGETEATFTVPDKEFIERLKKYEFDRSENID